MKPWVERSLADRLHVPPHLDLGELPFDQTDKVTMKATINSKILAKAIATAKRCLPSGGTLAILHCVHIEAVDGALKISATDLDRSVTITIPVEVLEPGAFVCSAGRLTVGLPFEGDVSISVSGGKVTLRGDNGKSELMTGDLSEWTATLKHEEGLVIESGRILPMIRRAHSCVSSDANRFAINGVRLEKDGDDLEAIGTNGACMSTNRMELPEWNQTAGTIPARVCEDMAALMDGEVNLRVSDKHISFCGDGVSYCARLIDAGFPNWKQVIPNKQGFEPVKLDRQALLSILSEVGVLDDNGANRVDWDCDGKQIRFSASNRAGDTIERFLAVPKCRKHKIAINSKYLTGLLKTCQADEVTVLISEDSTLPILVEAEGLLAIFTTLSDG